MGDRRAVESIGTVLFDSFQTAGVCRADAIRLINEAAPGEGVLKIKALEAFAAAADGKATKIIIPSELQGLAGLAAGAKAILEDGEKK